MKSLLIVMAALLLCTFIACDNNKTEKLNTPAANSIAQQDMTVKTMAPGALTAGEMAADTSIVLPNQTQQPLPSHAVQDVQDWDKKIIKTGHLTIEVKKYTAFDELVHTSIKKLGGYIAQEQQNQSDYKIENTVVIKVPVEQFEDAVQLLAAQNEKLVEKKITSEDVTGVLVDTKARMEAKKKVRDRYLDFLTQAKSMADVLKVQAEINGIQETIEAGNGRISYLGHAAAYSTIHVTYYQLRMAPTGEDATPSFGTRILASFKTGLQWLGECSIVLVALWPLWMGVIVVGFLFKRMRFFAVKRKQ